MQDACPHDWINLPVPDGRIVIGLDGGYIRDQDNRKKNFELIVGRSLPEDGDPRYIGFVRVMIESRNEASLINYSERYRSGERISSAFVEATVNAVISKRFAKKQQMQWSKVGAHLLLQTRTQTLDGSLRSTFQKWYPNMANDNQEYDETALAV